MGGFGIAKNSLTNKILKILYEYPENQFRATEVDRWLEKQKNKEYTLGVERKKRLQKIRVALGRLEKRGKILKHSHGYYGARIKHDTIYLLENPPITIHGIKLQCTSTLKYQKKIQGISANDNRTETILLLKTLGFKEVFREKPRVISLNRWTRDLGWEGRVIIITFHLKGLIEIFVNSSKSPLSYPEFCRCLDYLSGRLEPLTIFNRNDNVKLIQIGLGKDYKKLRLDGVRSLKLQRYMNAWSQVYYKEKSEVTRVETHLTVDMSVQDALDMLSMLSPRSNGHSELRDERRMFG